MASALVPVAKVVFLISFQPFHTENDIIYHTKQGSVEDKRGCCLYSHQDNRHHAVLFHAIDNFSRYQSFALHLSVLSLRTKSPEFRLIDDWRLPSNNTSPTHWSPYLRTLSFALLAGSLLSAESYSHPFLRGVWPSSKIGACFTLRK